MKNFLQQCLESVEQARKNLSIEVIVVDNASVDGSVEMVKKQFSDLTVIANKENTGFSKANNQGIKISQGEFVLLLNPDTVVAEDTFEKVLGFTQKNKDLGGLGVRMVDGKGEFLPESKRGLPTPWVAFYKIFGISKLFPKSRKFAQYHAGHIAENETAEIDILSGAFMLMKKEALDKVGLLDEDYFMYGEDIDLSYRIQKGGYKNYYFADTSIIHYKGESTKKGSVNYVFIFYRAMIIFAKKHFQQRNAKLFSVLINLAIYFRAGLAILSRFVKNFTLPFIDFAYIFGGSLLLTNYWEVKQVYFPKEIITVSIPIYSLIFLLSNWVNGSYDKPLKYTKFIKSTAFGLLVILLFYAVLPKEWQFSRLFIFASAGWIILYYLFSRLLLNLFFPKRFSLRNSGKENFVVQTNHSDFEEVKQKIKSIRPMSNRVEKHQSGNKILGELVFDSSSVSFKEIIESMIKNRGMNFDFKILPKKNLLLIGSNSIDTAGDIYLIDSDGLHLKEHQRKKRILDCSIGICILIFFPIISWFFSQKKQLFQNSLAVIQGKKSWIGYSSKDIRSNFRLPKIPSGIIPLADLFPHFEKSIQQKINSIYAQDFSVRKDILLLFKNWSKLDANPA